MRILYFHQYFATPEDSTGSRSYWISRHLVNQGHEVTMVTGNHSSSARGRRHFLTPSAVDGIRVLTLGIPYSQMLGPAGRMASFVAYAGLGSMLAPVVGRQDVVVATSTPLTAGIPGLVASRAFGAPFVFEVRDLWPEIPIAMGYLNNPLLQRLAWRLERLLYEKADKLVALSPGMERGMVKNGATAERITMIPNMAPLDLYAEPIVGPGWREERGVSAESLVVTHIGAMGMVNGLDNILDTAALLRGSGVVFAFVGSGSQRGPLEKRAREEGLDVVFDGPHPKKRMPWVLQGADIGLLCIAGYPVLNNNSANKLGDYLAAGLPVVANYPGWHARLLREYGAGIAVEDHHPSALANTLLSLRKDAKRLTDMGVGSKRLAAERFSADSLVRKFERVLLDAVR